MWCGEALTNADLIIYCAGTVKGLRLQDFEEANVSSLENVVNVALDVMRIPRVIYVSSLAASQPHLSAYSESKSRGESVLKKFHRIGLDYLEAYRGLWTWGQRAFAIVKTDETRNRPFFRTVRTKTNLYPRR